MPWHQFLLYILIQYFSLIRLLHSYDNNKLKKILIKSINIYSVSVFQLLISFLFFILKLLILNQIINFNNNGNMKKYSSYADLKLQPTVHYNHAPTTSKVGSPCFRKAIMYDNPVMMISKDQSYHSNGYGTLTPTNAKYSAAYAIKKKISINEKSEKNKSNNYYPSGSSRKENLDYNTSQNPQQPLVKHYDQYYNILNKGKNIYCQDGLKKTENIKKKGDSKSKKILNNRQSKEKNQKNPSIVQKNMKLSDLEIKGRDTRLDVQSPKSADFLFKNTQKQKQRERERQQKIRTRLKEKKQLSKNNKEAKQSKDENIKQVSKQTKQEKEANEDQLNEFVTKYEADKPLLLHCTSQNNLFPNKMRPLTQQSKDINSMYYLQTLYSSFFGVTANSNKLSTFQQICRNHLQTSIQFLSFARKNKSSLFPNKPHTTVKFSKEKNENQDHISRKQSRFESNRRPKNTIVFDLDETLIHCNQSLDLPHDIEIQIVFPNSSKIKAGINIRKHAKQCLKELSEYFEIIVFTASHQCYANKIIDYLDPQNKYVSQRLFREHCYKTKQGFYVKDLRILQSERNLDNLLLVDNAAYSYCFQPENGVPIIPFYNNKTDCELKEIVKYLKGFLLNPNKCLRSQNQEYMKLSQYYKYRDCKTLINQLYL